MMSDQQHPLWKLTPEQKRQACALYAQGSSSEAIGTEFGVYGATIRRLLNRRGVSIRDSAACQRRNTLNENAFSTLTPDAAYWIGFLMADGSVCEREVRIALSATDIAHLEAFRSFMGSSHAVSVYTPKGRIKQSACFSFRSAKVVSDLARYGIQPRKSLTAIATIECEVSKDFWRGIIDGDGTLDLPRASNRMGPVIRLVGSKSVLDAFARFVVSICPRWRGSVRSHKNIFCLAVSGPGAKRVIQTLYDGANYALARKRDKACRILEAVIGGGG